MSTFYVLPPRPVLGDRIAGLLQLILPGLDWDPSTRANLADAVAAAAAVHEDVFVIHREDLPEGHPSNATMSDGFGAAAGDDVIEIRPGVRPGEMTTRRWKIA